VRTVGLTALGGGRWELRLHVERETAERALRVTLACELGPAGAEGRVARVPVALPAGATTGDFAARLTLARPWPRGEHPIRCTAPQPDGPVRAWDGTLAVR
jgi:hypothetical protein